MVDLWRPQTKTDVIPFQVFPSFTFLLVCVNWNLLSLVSVCNVFQLFLNLATLELWSSVCILFWFFSWFSFHDQKAQELYDLPLWPIPTVMFERTLRLEENPLSFFYCLDSQDSAGAMWRTQLFSSFPCIRCPCFASTAWAASWAEVIYSEGWKNWYLFVVALLQNSKGISQKSIKTSHLNILLWVFSSCLTLLHNSFLVYCFLLKHPA